MFKSLKDKLGESLAGTPARNLIPVGQNKQVGRGGPSDSSTPSGSDRGHALSPDDISPLSVSRSRTSSVSSQASDISFASPISALTPGALDLDGSVSEVETDSTSVTAMNKDELYQMYRKVQQHSRQYKSAYLQVVTAYKEVEKDRDKLKSTLAQTQDKALKKISALKEQLESKKHAESNFTTMLNEKEELLKLLQLQVSLLKEGKPIPEELRSKSEQLSAVPSPEPSPPSEPLLQVDANSNISTDANVLREKVKRLESLLVKCQETMKSNKEKIQQLTTDREDMSQQLEMKSDELDKFKEEHKEAVLRFQSQLKDARKLIEDLESDKAMSLATMKQEFHETLESKDSELMDLKRKVHGLDKENTDLKDEVQKLTRTGGEQFEKSREIIRRLNEEKSHLEEEMRQKIENSEHSLEREKDSELQELRRGKKEALQVLQQQMQDKIRELEKAKELALEERDKEWKKKLSQKEQTKRKEFEEILTEEQEEMALAIEEQYLQRIAIAKQFEVAENNLREEHSQLKTEKKELEVRLENLRLETSSRIKSLEDELHDVQDANIHKLQEVQTAHGLELELVRKESESTLNQKLEELRVEYTLKISELSTNYERRLAESQAEEDASYETMMSDVKSRNEAAIRDSQVTISQLQSEAKESNERRAELEQRVAELEKELTVEKEVNERLSKEIGENDSRAKIDRDAFQERLKGLIQRIDYQSNSMDELSEENKGLYLEIASLRSKSEETIASMRDEMKRFCKNSYALSQGVGLEKSSELEEAGSSANGKADETGANQSSETHDTTPNLEALGADQLQAEVQRLAAEALLRRQHYSHQLASSADTIKSLEQRINDLIERENHLNVELEQSKKENERNLAAHNSEMSSLRSKIDQLSRSEKALMEQLQSTDERCETQISQASTENISAMSQFSELLMESQSEMACILGELMETKERSNRIVDSLEQELDQKCLELENAYRRIEELGGSCADLISQQPEPSGDFIAGDTSDLTHEGHVSTALPHSINENMPCSAETETVSPKNEFNHVGNVNDLEASDAESNLRQDENRLVAFDTLPVGDESSEELLRIISQLETALAEKDRRISWFESKVKDFGRQIQVETEEMKMRSRQVELLMADKDELLKDKGELVKNQGLMIVDLETKVRSLESALVTKSSDFEEIEKKFWQLQSEAKSRITTLKNRLIEKEAGTEGSDVPERVKQLREEFTAEMAEAQQKHEAEVKEMKGQLEKEQQSMMLFQENVRKQFDEKQEKVKFIIEKMRDNCQQSLVDRDHLYEIKLMNLERDKNSERDRVVQELTATIKKLQAEKQTSDEEETMGKQAEEINFLKAELESFKVRHRQAMSHFQSEREALLKHAGAGSDQLLELMRELEKKAGEDEVDVSSDLARKSLEEQLEKLSAENHALRLRATDLEKQRAAVLELAKEARFDSESMTPSGTEVIGRQAEEASAERKAAEEEMERLRNEIVSLRERVQMQEVEQKALCERTEVERTEADRTEADRTEADRTEADRTEADRTEADRTEADRTEADRTEAGVQRLGEGEELMELNKAKERLADELKEKVAKFEEMQKEENIKHLQELNELKELNKVKEDLICELNNKILALEETQRENFGRTEEIGEMKELHKLKQSTIDGLNEKVSALEEMEKENQKTWQEKENGFLERIRALEIQSTERVEEVARLLGALKTDSETLELANKLKQSTIDGLNEKVSALEETEKENRKTWQEKENGFLERIRALEVQSTERVEEVARLLGALKTDSETVELANASSKELLTIRVSDLENQLETKEKLFEDERRRLVEEKEAKCMMYEERLSEMEKTDLDLHTQLRELSDKLNSVSENALHLEKVVDEYRGLEVEYQRAIDAFKTKLEDERQRSEAVAQELEGLRRTVEEKDRSLLENNEKLLQVEAKLQKTEEAIHHIEDEHLAALESVNIEWQSKVDAIKRQNETVQTSEVGSNEAKTHLTSKSDAVSSLSELHNSHACGDMPVVQVNRAELPAVGGDGDIFLNGSGFKVEHVERKIHKVILPVVEFLPAATSDQSDDHHSFQEWHQHEVEQLRTEHKVALQLLEDEHNSKVIQLIKDFNVQMVERERQITETFQEEIETLRKTEARLLADHLEQTHDLNQQLNDRNSRIEEIVQNCEAQIQAADDRHKDHVDKLNQIIQDLQQTLLDKEHEWVTSREPAQVKEEQARSRSMLLGSEPTLGFSVEDKQMQLSSGHVPSSINHDLFKDRVVQLEGELEELKQKYRIEVAELTRRLERYESTPLSPLLPGLDHKASLIALGGDDVCRLLELQNSNLQAEVSRHLTENARLREREKELLCQLESKSVFLYGSHGESSASSSILGSLLMEPTEMEYLKNILYKYMIGLETKTLAKVICKVVRFSEDQTRLIMDKEESKSSRHSSYHQGATGSATTSQVGVRAPSTRRLAVQKSPPPVSL